MSRLLPNGFHVLVKRAVIAGTRFKVMVSAIRLHRGLPADEEGKQNLPQHHSNTIVDREYERKPTNQSLANGTKVPRIFFVSFVHLTSLSVV